MEAFVRMYEPHEAARTPSSSRRVRRVVPAADSPISASTSPDLERQQFARDEFGAMVARARPE
jgi:hypothetical protein